MNTLKKCIRSVNLIRIKIRRLINYDRYFINNSKRSYPNFIIFGAMRSGTTSLYQYLNGHPSLLSSTIKEPSYFSWRYNAGIKNYLNHFPYTQDIKAQLVFDASATTLHHPSAANRIKRVLPNIKLIAILRDPIERAISHYNYYSTLSSHYAINNPHSIEKREISQSFIDDMSGNEKRWNRQYCRFGHYGEQLKKYYQLFAASNILILDFNELKNNPKAILKRVSGFLKINSSYFELYEETNNKIPSAMSFKPMHKHELNIFNSVTYNMNLSPDMENKLIDFYREDVVQLLRLTKTNFSWSSKYT